MFPSQQIESDGFARRLAEAVGKAVLVGFVGRVWVRRDARQRIHEPPKLKCTTRRAQCQDPKGGGNLLGLER